MTTAPAARTRFLDKVEDYAPGQAARFAPPLDALVEWSEANGLTFLPPSAAQTVFRYAAPDSRRVFWAVTARTGDGAKLTILTGSAFPKRLRAEARAELARLDGRPEKEDEVPEVALTKLIWLPHRTRVLDLMTRLLAELRAAESGPAAAPLAVATG